MVSVLIDIVAAGLTRDAILQTYPTINQEDIDAALALAYAAEYARAGTVDLPLEPQLELQD